MDKLYPIYEKTFFGKISDCVEEIDMVNLWLNSMKIFFLIKKIKNLKDQIQYKNSLKIFFIFFTTLSYFLERKKFFVLCGIKIFPPLKDFPLGTIYHLFSINLLYNCLNKFFLQYYSYKTNTFIESLRNVFSIRFEGIFNKSFLPGIFFVFFYETIKKWFYQDQKDLYDEKHCIRSRIFFRRDIFFFNRFLIIVIFINFKPKQFFLYFLDTFNRLVFC